MTGRQRIAVVGAGVSGLVCAYLLQADHDVTLFEALDRPGGHTHTHQVSIAENQYAVDTGFIVFNRRNYPRFSALLDHLQVPSQSTEMSFSVHSEHDGLEYGATSIGTLFCQRRNLLRPAFWRMLSDIRRFYRQAPALLADSGPGPTTGEYLDAGGYSAAFRDYHLLPMASALWSAPASQVLKFPMRYMLQFFENHHMLQISNRPQWRVVRGGSRRYVDALLERFSGQLELGSPVTSVARTDDGVTVRTAAGRWQGQQVVFACHGDEALTMLADAEPLERELLSAFSFQPNEVVLHTDESLLPDRRRAWSSWNARIRRTGDRSCHVTYNMNILQSIDAPVTFCVSLNQTEAIDPQKILARMNYSHPVYTDEAVAAQARLEQIQGRNRAAWCGAWQGWGFHEDGVASAYRAAAAVSGRDYA